MSSPSALAAFFRSDRNNTTAGDNKTWLDVDVIVHAGPREGRSAAATLLSGLLGHGAVAALLTTGSLQLAQQALWYGKPLLLLPLPAFDQHDVALRFKALGVAQVVDLHDSSLCPLSKREATVSAHKVEGIAEIGNIEVNTWSRCISDGLQQLLLDASVGLAALRVSEALRVKGKAKALFLPIHLHFLLQRSNGTSREMQLVLPLLWKVRYYYSVLVDLSRK